MIGQCMKIKRMSQTKLTMFGQGAFFHEKIVVSTGFTFGSSSLLSLQKTMGNPETGLRVPGQRLSSEENGQSAGHAKTV